MHYKKQNPIFATAKSETTIVTIYCGVEQLVARWAHNPKVVSSSLAPATQKAVEKSAAFFVFTFGSNSTNMFTVYVLLSEKFNKIYIGYTSDLEKRFFSHNKLGTKGWTIKFRPWKIVHTETFQTKAEAMKRD